MKRNSLEVILRRLVLASLPALAGCVPTGGCPTPVDTQVVMSLADGGALPDGGCAAVCNEFPSASANPITCDPATTDGGQPAVNCHYQLPCLGRRGAPDERVAATPTDAPPLGALYAAAAATEGASVAPFQRLERELRAHGAPEPLVRAAARAAVDEQRHNRMMARLARRHGATRLLPAPAPAPDAAPRPLVEVAVENAVEGCVRETFGAALTIWQSEAASDGRTRRTLRAIATDEVRHAELAVAVSRWIAPRLDAEGRRAVEVARRAAVEELDRELGASPEPALAAAAGIPDAPSARRLLDGLRRELWSA
jgi:hypothetical protein